MKVVVLGEALMRSWSSQEVHIFSGVALAEGEFVDFFFAAEKVTVAFEKAFFEVIKDG